MIFKNHAGLEEKIQERFVPAALLLCALHYKVLPGGPTLDYVLSFNSLIETAAAEKNPADEKPQRWSDLMDQLGLFKSGRFELEVAAALRTGLIDYVALDDAIIEYQRPKQTQWAADRVREFSRDYALNHKKSNADLSLEANDMLNIVEHMDVDAISALHSVVLQIDQPSIADALIQRWFETHNFTPEVASNMLSARSIEHIHHAIVRQLQLTAAQATSLSQSLISVAKRIQSNIYLDQEELVISSSTVEQYVEALNILDREEFSDFIRLHLNWNRYSKNQPWKTVGVQNFVEASIRIVEESPQTRLANILRSIVFNGATTDLRNNVRSVGN